MENIIWVVLLCAVLALLFAAWKTSAVSKADAGTERMKEIAGNISDGARAFLFAEYKILVIFVAVLFVLIGLFITWLTAGCFLIGAVFSVCAGYVGMNVATKANVRTAAAAKSSGMNKALGVAFSGGSVMGMCVVGTGPPGGPAALHCHLIVRDGGIELSQQLTLPLGRLLVHLLEDIGGDCLGEIAEGDQGVGLISPRRQDRAAAEAGTGQAEGGDPHAPFLVLLHPMYSFSAPPQPGRGRAMGERLRVPRRPRVPGRAHFYTIVSG